MMGVTPLSKDTAAEEAHKEHLHLSRIVYTGSLFVHHFPLEEHQVGQLSKKLDDA